MKKVKQDRFDKQKEMVSLLIEATRKLGFVPGRNEFFKEVGMTRDEMRTSFEKYEDLVEMAVKLNPKAFAGVFTELDFTQDKVLETRKAVLKAKRLVVTTAVTGSKVRKDFLDALKGYCKKMKAALVIIPSGSDLKKLDSRLKGELILIDDIELNRNVKISTVMLNQKSWQPTSGMHRLGTRSQSVIYGATKLTKKVVATPGQHPHLVVTTGAVTKPWYDNKKSVLKQKSNLVAEHDHEISAVVVEIVDESVFHMRELQADVDGSIVDLNPTFGPIRYFANGTHKKEAAKFFKVGDWHTNETSEWAYREFPRIAKISQAEHTFLEDVHSYSQIGHHDNGKEISKIVKAENGKLDFVNEIKSLAEDLTYWKKNTKNLHIVASNHDEHLAKSIENGNFFQDIHNRRYYLELALEMLDGNDPLMSALEKYAGFDVDSINVVGPHNPFVLKNKYGTIDLSHHGHQGPSGAKGSPKALASSIGCGVTNHTHTPEIIAGGTNGGYGNGSLWVGGCSVVTDGPDVVEYAKNNVASAWLKCSTLGYQSKNGRLLRQQITLIGDGKWHLDQGAPKEKGDKLAEVCRKRLNRAITFLRKKA